MWTRRSRSSPGDTASSSRRRRAGRSREQPLQSLGQAVEVRARQADDLGRDVRRVAQAQLVEAERGGREGFRDEAVGALLHEPAVAGRHGLRCEEACDLGALCAVLVTVHEEDRPLSYPRGHHLGAEPGLDGRVLLPEDLAYGLGRPYVPHVADPLDRRPGRLARPVGHPSVSGFESRAGRQPRGRTAVKITATGCGSPPGGRSPPPGDELGERVQTAGVVGEPVRAGGSLFGALE